MMTIKEALEILHLENAGGKKEIKAAYRKQLPFYNPEEDEEGFLKLRKAYDVAMQWTENDNESVLDDFNFSDFVMSAEKSEEEPKSKEETCIEALVNEINRMYRTVSDRNNLRRWDELLSNDIFLNIDYAKQAKLAVIGSIIGKYAFKSETIRFIFDKMKVVEERLALWDEFAYEDVVYLMNKFRDPVDYTDLLFQEPDVTDEVERLQLLIVLFQELYKENMDEKRILSVLTSVFSLGETGGILEAVEVLMLRYPNDFYTKMIALKLYELFEGSEEKRTSAITGIQKTIVDLYIKTYMEDDRFICWKNEYLVSINAGENEQTATAFSKLGEYALASEYLMKHADVLELVEREVDRLLIRSCMEIDMAVAAKKRKEAVLHWNKAKEFLDVVYEREPEHKSMLVLRMLVASELYDVDCVTECYDMALSIIPQNPYIYGYRFKMYCRINKLEDAKELFDTVNRNEIEDLGLRLLELIFRSSYDFIESYCYIQNVLDMGHLLLDKICYLGVSGELLADAYFTFGWLISADGRYGNAYEYFHAAIDIVKKPEYLFYEAMDYITNKKDYYEDALRLFEQVYDMRELWDDEESKNPSFSYHWDSYRNDYLSSNESADLFNLYIMIGYCHEKLDELVEAVNYYRRAIEIDSSVVELVSALVRVLDALLDSGEFTISDAEQYMNGLDHCFEEFCAVKYLRARIAYCRGDVKSAKSILIDISKIKIVGYDFMEADWRTYANFLLGKVYHEEKKDAFAVKYLQKAGEGIDDDIMNRLADNIDMVKNILNKAKALFEEMGYDPATQWSGRKKNRWLQDEKE